MQGGLHAYLVLQALLAAVWSRSRRRGWCCIPTKAPSTPVMTGLSL